MLFSVLCNWFSLMWICNVIFFCPKKITLKVKVLMWVWWYRWDEIDDIFSGSRFKSNFLFKERALTITLLRATYVNSKSDLKYITLVCAFGHIWMSEIRIFIPIRIRIYVKNRNIFFMIIFVRIIFSDLENFWITGFENYPLKFKDTFKI